MSMTEPLYHLLGDKHLILSKEEKKLLEVELFICICKELKNIFKKQHQDYFRLIKFSHEKENEMLDSSFLRLIIQDVLATEEYSMEGIAYYTNIPQEVLQEIMCGQHSNPSVMLFRRIMELHRSVRRELYHAILNKVTHVVEEETSLDTRPLPKKSTSVHIDL